MRIITRANAQSYGITLNELYGPRFRRLFHGVYVDVDVLPTLRVLVAGARALLPEATVTGVTALRLRGASLGTDSPVWLRSPKRISRQGIKAVLGDRPQNDAVADLVTALQDADLRLVDEVVTLDELRRKKRVSRSEAGELAAHRPLAWGLSVANSASVRESRTRMLMHTAGLPAPRRQYWIARADGSAVGRVDFAWPEHKVVVEYEGQQHLTNAEQWESDIKRYEELERLGWTVIRVTAASLRDPVTLVYRIDAALRAGGYRGRGAVLDARWLEAVA
ncbi:endonuclease domain-containing protein [Propionibacteriaceae bacterium G57]|uniref:endonuclease domain-containing protein n=1 Tax=Aestuariimicrobium sp. G57 TaxID=3418485 RepID=UPI003DA731E9